MNQTDRKNQFDEEISRFNTLYNENIVPTMENELDIQDFLPDIERSYARISLLHDCMKSDEDIKKIGQF